MRIHRQWLGGCGLLVLLAFAAGAMAQNSPGGAFLTNFDYILDTPNGWLWRTLTPWRIEGATDDASETTITFVEPTADRTITFQNATGTVVLSPGVTSGATASGSVGLDGSNPTSVTTGLTTLLGCVVTLQTSTAPGDEIAAFSLLTTASAGRLDIYAWEFTSGTDPTLVASNWTDVVQWFCNGTR